MVDTRHLDTAINILKGTGASKRAPRKAQVTLALHIDRLGGTFTITSNGKELVSDKLADCDPRMALKARVVALQARKISTYVEIHES